MLVVRFENVYHLTSARSEKVVSDLVRIERAEGLGGEAEACWSPGERRRRRRLFTAEGRHSINYVWSFTQNNCGTFLFSQSVT
jgi:hypothetical protein